MGGLNPSHSSQQAEGTDGSQRQEEVTSYQPPKKRMFQRPPAIFHPRVNPHRAKGGPWDVNVPPGPPENSDISPVDHNLETLAYKAASGAGSRHLSQPSSALPGPPSTLPVSHLLTPPPQMPPLPRSLPTCARAQPCYMNN